MIWDPETEDFKPLPNSATDAAHGAGTGAVQNLLNMNVGLVLAQRVGPKAFAVLKQADVKIYGGITGKTVTEALDSYQAGGLPELLSPSN